jgi:hypothetical protein
MDVLLIDYVMPQLSGSAYKIFCFIFYKTKGHDRRNCQLSYQQIMTGTGQAKGTVCTGLKELLSSERFGMPLILVRHADKSTGTHSAASRYALNPNFYILESDIEAFNAPGAFYHKKAISPKIRAFVQQRDGHKCRHCGATEHLCTDHIYPEFLGGTSDVENLQTLCRSCNSRKGIRLVAVEDDAR